MPAPYNSNETLTNATGMWDKIVVINDSASGSLGIMLLLVIGVTAFMVAMKRNSPARAFGYAGFVNLLLSYIFFAGGLIDSFVLGVSGIIAILAMVSLYLGKE